MSTRPRSKPWSKFKKKYLHFYKLGLVFPRYFSRKISRLFASKEYSWVITTRTYRVLTLVVLSYWGTRFPFIFRVPQLERKKRNSWRSLFVYGFVRSASFLFWLELNVWVLNWAELMSIKNFSAITVKGSIGCFYVLSIKHTYTHFNYI